MGEGGSELVKMTCHVNSGTLANMFHTRGGGWERGEVKEEWGGEVKRFGVGVVIFYFF